MPQPPQRHKAAPISPDSTDEEISAATDAAEAELALVASVVPDFAHQLDDGTGFFNSSTGFGRQLARHFDKVRRGSTVMGVLDDLDVAEVLLRLMWLYSVSQRKLARTPPAGCFSLTTIGQQLSGSGQP